MSASIKTAAICVAALCGCLVVAVIVLPLRLNSDCTYVGPSLRIPDGLVSAEVNPTYYRWRHRFWFDGIKSGSPYSIRLFFCPDGARAKNLVVMSGLLKDGPAGVQVALPEKKAYGPIADCSGHIEYIVGYRNFPLTADDISIDVAVLTGNETHAAHIELRQTQTERIVHAVWEGMNGI